MRITTNDTAWKVWGLGPAGRRIAMAHPELEACVQWCKLNGVTRWQSKGLPPEYVGYNEDDQPVVVITRPEPNDV